MKSSLYCKGSCADERKMSSSIELNGAELALTGFEMRIGRMMVANTGRDQTGGTGGDWCCRRLQKQSDQGAQWH